MTTNDSEINISDTTLDDLKTNYYASLKSAFQLVSSTSLPTTYYSQIIEALEVDIDSNNKLDTILFN